MPECEQQIRAFCSSLPLGIFFADEHGRWIHVNETAAELLGAKRPEAAGLEQSATGADRLLDEAPIIDWLAKVHVSDRDRVASLWRGFLQDESCFSDQFRLQQSDDTAVWVEVNATKRDGSGKLPSVVVGTLVDVSSHKQTEQFLELENDLLETVATGIALEEALLRLVRFIESQSNDMLASVLLLDPDGKRLLLGAAPSLDDAYNDLVDGIQIGEGAGSCGTAAFRGEPVFVNDIESDPLWAGVRGVARRFGLRACWSTPLKDREGNVLGTFAVYRKVPGPPTARHVRVIDVATHLASILLARHRDDQKLMRSEQRFRHIFEHAAVGVGQIESRSGEILRVNRRYCEILGTPEHELRGKTWMELTHPSDLAADEWQMARLLSGEIREFAMEKRLQRGDGSFVWVNLNVSAMWPEGGEPTTHSAVLEDITERKRAEEALRLSEQRFRNLVQTAPFGVLRIDLDGCITFCNAAVSTIYDCAPKDLIGEKIWDLGFEHADRQCMIEHMPARGDVASPVRNRQPGQGFLVKHRTRDGRTIEVYLDWTFERDRDENIIGRIIVISDVTKRREFERRLEFQADVLNRVSDAIIVTDQRHAVTYANEAAQRMFEISDQHRSGNTILPIHRELLLSGSMHPGVIEALQSTGRWQGEMELEIDGGEAIVEVKLKRFRSPDSHDRYLLLLLRDISMRKHAELERRQHRDTLAHVTRLSTMGELVAGLAHEVKQPLYAITNYATAASISLRNLEPGGRIEETWLEDLKEFNDGVRRASQRAGEIIQRLREFARKSDQSRETLNLNEVIHDSIDLVAFEARQCDAIVTLQLQEPLPRVLADRVQCEQVIVNLLHNAYEALEKVDPPRRVIVRTRSRGKTVEIEVEDNGPGIAAEEQSRIFEAFCTNKPGGMGMGLAISRTIVEDHGGRLSVESNSRGGATFTVSLPVAV